MASLTAGEKISVTVADQVRIYKEEYLAALLTPAPEPEWINLIAAEETVTSPLVRFPIALMSGSFQETKADNRDVEWSDKYVDLSVTEYDWGYEAKAEELASNPVKQKQWAAAPAAAVSKERRKMSQLVAATLEANPTGYDGVALFHDSHPIDGGGTFDNLQATTMDPTSASAVLAEKILGEQQLKDSDGQLLGAEFDTVMMVPSKASALRFLLQQNFIPNAAGTATQSNPLPAASLNVVGNPFLTGNYAYFISSALMKSMPALVAVSYDPGSPLRLRQFGFESDHFKSTGRVKNSHHIWIGCGALFPNAIRRVALA